KEHRRLELHRGRPVERATKGVVRAAPCNIRTPANLYRLRDVPRSETGRCKSADQVRPALEVVEHAQALAAPAGGKAALAADQTDHVGENFVIEPGVEG